MKPVIVVRLGTGTYQILEPVSFCKLFGILLFEAIFTSFFKKSHKEVTKQYGTYEVRIKVFRIILPDDRRIRALY